MRHAWVVGVLLDIEEYAIANDLAWLIPLMNKAKVIAKLETLKISGPLPALDTYVAERDDDLPAVDPSSQRDIGEHHVLRANHLPAHQVSAHTAYAWIKRISAKLDNQEKSGSVWKFTPAALTQICMISDGKGGFVGDEIFRNKAQPYIQGCQIEIVMQKSLRDCRFAFVDPLSACEEWYSFLPMEVGVFENQTFDVMSLPVYTSLPTNEHAGIA